MPSGCFSWLNIVAGDFGPFLVSVKTKRLNIGLDLMRSFLRKTLTSYELDSEPLELLA